LAENPSCRKCYGRRLKKALTPFAIATLRHARRDITGQLYRTRAFFLKLA